MSEPLFPGFLKLEGRKVVLVGGGAVAAAKLDALLAARASVTVVAPEIGRGLERAEVRLARRAFEPSDLDGAWLAVAAATPEVNSAVALAAEERRVFVNAVDEPAKASLYAGGVVRKGGVTLAVSTDGEAPALAGLIREALEGVLPEEISKWKEVAREARRRWREDGVPVRERRPLLLDALNALYGEKKKTTTTTTTTTTTNATTTTSTTTTMAPAGFVSLVGAGPGDVGLLTLRAKERLESAEVVLYDALVSKEALALAGKARKIYVGKRARKKSISQEAIQRLLVRFAQAGKRVVRLKCGDPFVLGRGGEEALALAAAGVAFEVVPGVSSAIAAAALAGIPVTHRGIASGFVVVSGHSAETFRPVLASLEPDSLTVVVLMGIATRREVARTLLARGWRGETPVAVLLAASTSESASWIGTLDELSVKELDFDETSPGTLAIGEVVTLAPLLSSHLSGCEARSLRHSLPSGSCDPRRSVVPRARASRSLSSLGLAAADPVAEMQGAS